MSRRLDALTRTAALTLCFAPSHGLCQPNKASPETAHTCYTEAAALCGRTFNGAHDLGANTDDLGGFKREVNNRLRPLLPFDDDLPDVALVLPAPSPSHETRRVAMEMLVGMCRAITFYACAHQETSGRLPFNIVPFGDGNTVSGAIAASHGVIHDQRIVAAVGHYTLRNTTVASKEYLGKRLAVISPTAEISLKKFYPNTLIMNNSLQEVLDLHDASIISAPEHATREPNSGKASIAVCTNTETNLSATTDFYGKFLRRLADQGNPLHVVTLPCTPLRGARHERLYGEEPDRQAAGKVYEALKRSKADRVLLLLGADQVGMSFALMDKLRRHPLGPLNVTANSTLMIPALLEEHGCTVSFERPKGNAGKNAFRVMVSDTHAPSETVTLKDILTLRTLNTQDALLAVAKAFEELTKQDEEAAKEAKGAPCHTPQRWIDFYVGPDRDARLSAEDGPLLKKLKSPFFSFSLSNDLPDAPSSSAGHVVFHRRRTFEDVFPNEPFAKEMYVTCKKPASSTEP